MNSASAYAGCEKPSNNRYCMFICEGTVATISKRRNAGNDFRAAEPVDVVERLLIEFFLVSGGALVVCS